MPLGRLTTDPASREAALTSALWPQADWPNALAGYTVFGAIYDRGVQGLNHQNSAGCVLNITMPLSRTTTIPE